MWEVSPGSTGSRLGKWDRREGSQRYMLCDASYHWGQLGLNLVGKSQARCRACLRAVPPEKRQLGIYTAAPLGPCLRAAPEHWGEHFHPPWTRGGHFHLWWPKKVSGKILQALAVGNETGKWVPAVCAQWCLAHHDIWEETEAHRHEDMTKHTRLIGSEAGASNPAVQLEHLLWTTTHSAF